MRKSRFLVFFRTVFVSPSTESSIVQSAKKTTYDVQKTSVCDIDKIICFRHWQDLRMRPQAHRKWELRLLVCLWAFGRCGYLESQKQLFSKLCLRLKKSIKKIQKVLFVCCFESHKKLFWSNITILFETVFETQKSLFYVGFYCVLSFLHFFGPLKSS